MGNNSAGMVGKPNEGQTDMDRGKSVVFPYNKGGRKTGKVGTPSGGTNDNTVDGNKRVVNDPRLS